MAWNIPRAPDWLKTQENIVTGQLSCIVTHEHMEERYEMPSECSFPEVMLVASVFKRRLIKQHATAAAVAKTLTP